jgi:hypothetical protein
MNMANLFTILKLARGFRFNITMLAAKQACSRCGDAGIDCKHTASHDNKYISWTIYHE